MAEQQLPDSVKKPKKSKLGLLLLPVALLSMGAGGFFAFNQHALLTRVATAVASPPEEERGGKPGRSGDGEEEEESGEPTTYGVFKTLDGLTVNPAGTDGMRFLLVSVGLEAEKEETLAEVDARDIVVRDAIVRVLSSRTVSELTDSARRDSLKESIRKEVNHVLSTGAIERLYFTQYVMQ